MGLVGEGTLPGLRSCPVSCRSKGDDLEKKSMDVSRVSMSYIVLSPIFCVFGLIVLHMYYPLCLLFSSFSSPTLRPLGSPPPPVEETYHGGRCGGFRGVGVEGSVSEKAGDTEEPTRVQGWDRTSPGCKSGDG